MDRICENPPCDNPLPDDGTDRLYCSGRCKSAAARARRTVPPPRNIGPRVKDTPPRECQRCGVIYQPIQPLTQRFCSKTCRQTRTPGGPRLTNPALPPGPRQCPICGAEFTTTRATGTPRVYCSRACRKRSELLARVERRRTLTP